MRIEFARGRADTNKKSEEWFHISNCGYFVGIDKDYNKSRPNGRVDYQLIFVANGYLEILLDEEKVVLEKNTYFLFPPNVPQNYSCPAEAETSFYWLHFSGALSEKILSDCNIRKLEVTEVDAPEEYIVGIKELVNSIKNGYNETYVNSVAMKCIAYLGKSAQTSNLERVIGQMHYDIRHHIFDNDYAQTAGFSKYHFIRRFGTKFGVSPNTYFNNLRIEKSKFLLLETEMKISDIASELGFYDQFYFSKQFKKSTGMTPTKYRSIKGANG